MNPAVRRHVYALLGYAAIAIAFTWPLLPNISTHLTGSPAGDTGVYVWNQWVFQHELLNNHRSPYFTDRIFSSGASANLSLHNYTPFQNLVALPLIPWLGVVATFNVVYLLMTVLTGYAGLLLVRHVTGAWAEAWLAGVLFAWSPPLVTRGGAHFSLVAAAPLAVFMLLLLRTADRQRLRDALALGVTCAWAASADAYYGVYCVVLAALFVIPRVVTIDRPAAAPVRHGAVAWTLDVLLFCVGGLVVSMLISGGWQITVLGRVASMRSLYTPMLLLTLLACARLAWSYRPNVRPYDGRSLLRLVRLSTVSALIAAAMLSPILYAAAVRVAEGRWDVDQIFWRSSPRGVDLAALILPNPNHPWAPDSLRAWLSPRPDAYYENVASLTFVGLLTLAAAWRAGWRIPRFWGGLALVFGALSLGPFVHVLGVNTHIPGPWAFLRYVPVVGLARTPSRFSIVLMLMLAVLFGAALYWMGTRWPARRRLILLTVAALLLFELLPAPRPLYSAEVPTIYNQIAAVPDDTVRVLELPFGVRDGTRSVGNFSARSQYFQTVHRKPLIGGYLSRVSRRRIADLRRDPMSDALIWLSEGRELDDSRRRSLVADGPSYVTRAKIGFVVIDRDRTPEPLRRFAIRAFDLRLVDADGAFALYTPAR